MGSSTCQEGLAQAKEVLGDGVIKLKLIPVDFYLEFIQNDLSCAIDKQIFAGMRNTGPDPASQGQMQRFASKVQLWSFPVAKIGLVSGHFARLLKNNVSCQDHPARYVPPPMPPAGMAHAHQNAAEELAEEEEPEEDPEVGEPKITPARHEVQQEAPATLQDTILMEQMVFQTRRTTDLKECLAGVLATNSEGAGGGKWPDPLEEARFHRRTVGLMYAFTQTTRPPPTMATLSSGAWWMWGIEGIRIGISDRFGAEASFFSALAALDLKTWTAADHPHPAVQVSGGELARSFIRSRLAVVGRFFSIRF